ncbi:MAG: ATP-dependent Clp protease adaptor ClpS [Opitutales bacterium]
MAVFRMAPLRAARLEAVRLIAFRAGLGQRDRRMAMQPEESPTPVLEEATADEQAPRWQVVVLNDPVNLMTYVVMVFRKVFGYSLEKARRHMLEVHEAGRSILWTGDREKAEAYTYTLQQWQLRAKLEPVDDA